MLAVGTRLQDFTTGSWTAFDPTARFVEHQRRRVRRREALARAVVGDARECLRELARIVDGWSGPHRVVGPRGRETPGVSRVHRQDRGADRRALAAQLRPGRRRRASIADRAERLRADGGGRAAGRAHQRLASEGGSTASTASTGSRAWATRSAGAWGAHDGACPTGEVISFVGDGSYLMMNSELYSSVLVGHKLIVIVCDNGGLRGDRPAAGQPGRGRVQQHARRTPGPSSRRRASTSRPTRRRWAASPRRSSSIAELEAAFEQARRTSARRDRRRRRAANGPRAACSGRSVCPRSASRVRGAPPGPCTMPG